MLDDGMLLMNDAFRDRVDTSEDSNFKVNILDGDDTLLEGSFVSLMQSADGDSVLVFTTTNFWKAIDLSKNFKDYSNLYIRMNDMIISTVDTSLWHMITVERVGQAARVTLSVNPSLEEEENV